MLLKILKGLVLAGIAVAALGVMIFITAGFLPVKDALPGESKSCYVTMKDGTKLAVWYNLPESVSKGEKVPAIMETTRYVAKSQRSFILKALLNLKIAREVPDITTKTFIESNYAYVKLDARGSGASFGNRKMEWSREEIFDMGQVIDWISKQSWCNGKVGAYGMSYSGNTAELAMVSKHPALKASAPLYPDFDTMSQAVMPGGVFNDKLIKEWHESTEKMDKNNIKDLFFKGIAAVDGDKNGKLLKTAIKEHKTIDIYEAFKNITYSDDILADNYSATSISPYNYTAEIEESKVPLYVKVGWMDAGTVNGAIERFLTYNNNQTLEIGPWSHAGWHIYDPLLSGSKSRQELEKQQAEDVVSYFNKYLKDDAAVVFSGNKIRYYTFGEGKWKTSDTWPVKGFENKKFYFSEGGMLKETKPDEENGEDTYKIDFSASTGESNRWMTNLGGGAVFYPDRSGEDKKLLTYTSDAIENDVEITGLPVVTLNLTSTAKDGAFFTYLEDVAPDGKVTYITEGQLRALHRKTTDENLGYKAIGPKRSYAKKDAELLIPGENTEMKIGMYATSVLIKKGHRIRIAIAGHDASIFRRIPANGDPVIKIQRNSTLSSYVELPMKVRYN